jgi:hypothetical protein
MSKANARLYRSSRKNCWIAASLRSKKSAFIPIRTKKNPTMKQMLPSSWEPFLENQDRIGMMSFSKMQQFSRNRVGIWTSMLKRPARV